mmetsp:Transcript_53126/g.141074  ORF Transcript_53126/g.141074 Transcript_53126/m.141074 type:complete len:200 (-) Transcript_53126:8-607(-)
MRTWWTFAASARRHAASMRTTSFAQQASVSSCSAACLSTSSSGLSGPEVPSPSAWSTSSPGCMANVTADGLGSVPSPPTSASAAACPSPGSAASPLSRAGPGRSAGRRRLSLARQEPSAGPAEAAADAVVAAAAWSNGCFRCSRSRLLRTSKATMQPVVHAAPRPNTTPVMRPRGPPWRTSGARGADPSAPHGHASQKA